MSENIIKLEFRKDIRKLAGNKLGEETYDNIKNNLDYNNLNVLVFPDYIDGVAISFVQGFTRNIFEKINKDEFTEYFKIEGNDRVVDKFLKSIYF